MTFETLIRRTLLVDGAMLELLASHFVLTPVAGVWLVCTQATESITLAMFAVLPDL